MSEPGQPPSDLEQVFLEYLQHVDQHGTIDPQEILQRYPHLAGELQALIETASHVKQMAGPRLNAGSEPAADSAQTDAASVDTIIAPPGEPPQPVPTPGDSLIGTELGDYRILEELGRGGMGVVYKAWQIGVARVVAFKMIRSGRLASDSDVDRFYLEAKAAGRLNHQSIVDVYQVGQIGGHHFFSMEYVPGDNLAEYVRRNQSSWRDIAELMRQVAEAIDYAHREGVLHRDLKPSNILVNPEGRPRVTDFGLAKDLWAADDLTSSGSTVGTPSYMPPEQAQARRDEISRRSDVYSLGAILYALLTDRPPFRARSTADTLMQVIHEEPVRPRAIDPECPRGLEAISLKCLEKSPGARYATAGELAEDLGRYLQGERVHARPSRLHHRAWQWIRNVPLVAAAMGRKSASPTAWHVRSQWMALAAVIGVIAGVILWPGVVEWHRLRTIDVSTGPTTGKYFEIGHEFADRLKAITNRDVQPHVTKGSVEGRGGLLDGEFDLAFIQDNVFDNLKVVTLLYEEVTLILVRQNTDMHTVDDLRDRRIALGPNGSGMRRSSRELLRAYGIDERDLHDVDRAYTDLAVDPDLEGAIITIRIDALRELAASGEFRLLPLIPGRSRHEKTLQPADLPGLVPQQGTVVITTTAILAVREQTPDWLVNVSLDALYGEGGLADRYGRLFSRDDVAASGDLNYHPAARRYFRALPEGQ